jgi:hypothetical protein
LCAAGSDVDLSLPVRPRWPMTELQPVAAGEAR